MPQGIMNGAGQLQQVGMAILVVMIIVLGMRLFGHGPKGFAAALTEIVGLIIGAFMVFRPNDAVGILTHMFGGIQTPTMPS